MNKTSIIDFVIAILSKYNRVTRDVLDMEYDRFFSKDSTKPQIRTSDDLRNKPELVWIQLPKTNEWVISMWNGTYFQIIGSTYRYYKHQITIVGESVKCPYDM